MTSTQGESDIPTGRSVEGPRMKDSKAAHRKSEYRRAYRCISNQKRHDIWQENAEYRQERRRRDAGHESWNWDTNSSDDECTCGCGMNGLNGVSSFPRDFSKSMGDLRLNERDSITQDDRSSAGTSCSSPRGRPSSPREVRQRSVDKSVSTDDLSNFVEKSTQTEACSSKGASSHQKRKAAKVRFTAPADQSLRRNSAEAVKSRPNSALYQSEYRSSFMPIRF